MISSLSIDWALHLEILFWWLLDSTFVSSSFHSILPEGFSPEVNMVKKGSKIKCFGPIGRIFLYVLLESLQHRINNIFNLIDKECEISHEQ
jgi:hypothetical protein